MFSRMERPDQPEKPTNHQRAVETLYQASISQEIPPNIWELRKELNDLNGPLLEYVFSSPDVTELTPDEPFPTLDDQIPPDYQAPTFKIERVLKDGDIIALYVRHNNEGGCDEFTTVHWPLEEENRGRICSWNSFDTRRRQPPATVKIFSEAKERALKKHNIPNLVPPEDQSSRMYTGELTNAGAVTRRECPDESPSTESALAARKLTGRVRELIFNLVIDEKEQQ